MLHWIQERYGAEIVTLTVNLGQPDEDWEAITGKARDLGAVETLVVDAREEFAADYVLPAIQANALYGGGYPLFTALGRPLIAKLAVEQAREHGCDTIAHGCTGKGNDQVRIEATVATLAPGAEAARAGPRVADGPRGGDRLRPRARDPGLGRHRGGRRTRSTTTSGALVGGPSRSRTSTSRPRRRLPARHPTGGGPGRAGDCCGSASRPGRPVSLDGEQLGSGRAARSGRRPRAAATGSASSTTSRTGSSGSRCATSTRCPAATIVLAAHKDLEKLVSTIHQNNFKATLETHWAYLCYAGLWHEPLRERPRRLHAVRQRYVTGEVTVKLYKGSATPVARQLALRALRPRPGRLRRVRRRVQPAGEPGLHRALLAAEPARAPGPEHRERLGSAGHEPCI